jgi:hypothetical protein
MSLNSVLKSLNGNTFKISAVILAGVFIVWIYGCESQVRSLLDDSHMVSRSELVSEFEVLKSRMQSRVTSLDQKDAIKKALLDQASIFSTSGQFNPTGLLNTIISIVAVGTAVDARRKLKNASPSKT